MATCLPYKTACVSIIDVLIIDYLCYVMCNCLCMCMCVRACVCMVCAYVCVCVCVCMCGVCVFVNMALLIVFLCQYAHSCSRCSSCISKQKSGVIICGTAM